MLYLYHEHDDMTFAHVEKRAVCSRKSRMYSTIHVDVVMLINGISTLDEHHHSTLYSTTYMALSRIHRALFAMCRSLIRMCRALVSGTYN